jgi:hypothetical protein
VKNVVVLIIDRVGIVYAARENGQKESWWIYSTPASHQEKWLSVVPSPASPENHFMANDVTV